MRGFGTLYTQRGSRFIWMQWFQGGRRFRASTNCEGRSAAGAVLKRKLLEIEQTEDLGAGTIATLYDLIERDYAMNGRKSIAHLRSMWRNHIRTFFAKIDTAKLTGDQVAQYIQRRQAAGAANASINRELAALKRMYKLAVKSGKLKVVPHIAMLKERNVRTGFVKDADYKSLARESEVVGLWMRTLFELAYTYAWRKTELRNLRISQVDLNAGTIELNPGETKNDQGRVVQMTGRIRGLIANCIAGKDPDDLVLTRPDGSPVGNFRRTWVQVCRRAGVPGLLFHDLRRTGVRNMRRAGISEKVAMGISGHKTRAVFERYNIIDPTDLREAAIRMERAEKRMAAAPKLPTRNPRKH